MRCPHCGNSGTLGILQQHRRRQGSRTVNITFFCNSCCIEFTTRNGRVVNAVTIDADGETQTLNVPQTPEFLFAANA